MIRKLTVLFVLLLLIILPNGATAQVPGSVHIMLPNGNSFVESMNASGTLSSGGITCTWSTTDGSATITFVGNYTTTWIHPSIDLAWFNTTGVMPLAITFTEAGTGTYDFSAPINTGTWDTSIDYNDLTGNWVYGNSFPISSRFDLDIGLNDQSTDYNMTIDIEWGEGVAAAAGSWGNVKSLFQ